MLDAIALRLGYVRVIHLRPGPFPYYRIVRKWRRYGA